MMVVKKRYMILLCLLLVGVLLIGCAPGNDRWDPAKEEPGIETENRAGFWAGLWHGFIIVITFIVSLFTDEVGIYEVNNKGWSYNLGYLIGICIAMSWAGRMGRKRKRLRKSEVNDIADAVSERVTKGVEETIGREKSENRD
ncbi:MAG: hypothetical protein JSV25_05090 [Spirochaetota bacterium]|nr:MAG: hypothetical protein JSV25_05090 [Spirochaetota bacterium]